MSIKDELRSIIGYVESRLSRLEGLHEGSMKGIEARLAELEARVGRIERLEKWKKIVRESELEHVGS